MAVDDRIPLMSGPELANLLANAERLIASGPAVQKAEAERILPLVMAALEASKVAKSEAQQKAMADRRDAMANTRKKKADAAEAAGIEQQD